MASSSLLPSKVYEDGVARNRSREEKVSKLQEKIVQRASERGIMLVKARDLPAISSSYVGEGLGMLSDEQRQWLNSAPYDNTTGNPVVSRNKKLRGKRNPKEVEREEGAQEVRSLIDHLSSTEEQGDGSSDLYTRIQARRKERHDQAFGDMHQALASISEEFESRVRAECMLLKEELSGKKQEIEKVFSGIQDDKALCHSSLEDLEVLWSKIVNIFAAQRKYISNRDQRLHGIEDERAAKVGEILRHYGDQLTGVAYYLSDDVEKLIEEEAMRINLAIVTNRRTYTQLSKHLVTVNFMSERENRDRWKDVVSQWRQVVCRSVEERFLEFMASQRVLDPAALQTIRLKLASEQESINQVRESLLTQLSVMGPPKISKGAAYNWKEKYSCLHRDLAHAHSTFLLSWQKAQEDIAIDCESQLRSYKDSLVSNLVMEAAEADRTLNERLAPVIELHRSKGQEELRKVERCLEAVLESQETKFFKLFQYAQGAADQWENHWACLRELEHTHLDKLSGIREKHDQENQFQEISLDIILDRLRQAASQQELDEYLKDSLIVLEKIKNSYFAFHEQMLSEVQQYPFLVETELSNYDLQLCKYFGVQRSSLKKPRSKSRPSGEENGTPLSRHSKRNSVGSRAVSHKEEARATATRSLTPLEEVLATSLGTAYYVTPAGKDVGKVDGRGISVFLTQDEDVESSLQISVVDSMLLAEAKFTEAKNGFRKNFLEHVESWRLESLNGARECTSGREEELKTELELRLHLHEPRPSRIREDIHDIRELELASHRDRVGQHSKAVSVVIQEQRSFMQSLPLAIQDQMDRFTEALQSLERELASVQSTIILKQVLSKAERACLENLGHLEQLIFQHRNIISASLSEAANSNKSFLESLQPFSNGGNYCPQEIEIYQQKLSKMSTRISKAQRQLADELDTLQESSAEKIDSLFITKFKNQFQHQLTDLSCTETIQKMLTNCQIKIKSEVADSNLQSQKISDIIKTMEDLLAQTQSDLDHDPQVVLHKLPKLFLLLLNRVNYLYCRASQLRGTRVGEVGMAKKPGQHAGAISAITVTKSIMGYVSGREEMQTGPGADARTLVRLGEFKSGRMTSKKKQQVIVDRRTINFGIGGGEEGVECFLPKIRVILLSSYRGMYNFVEAYYQAKGPRLPLRLTILQETFESCLDGLIDRYQCYRRQAEDYRNKCIDEFHTQLVAVASTLSQIPRLLFGHLQSKHERDLKEKMSVKSQAYQQTMEDLTRTKHGHEDKLRPALGHPNRVGELQALCQEEEERHISTLRCITQHSQSAQEIIRSQAKLFVSELLAASEKLLSQYDGVVDTSEIIPPSTRIRSREELLRNHIHPQPVQNTEPRRSSVQPSSHVTGTSLRFYKWPRINDLQLAFGDEALEKKLSATLSSKKTTAMHRELIGACDTAYKEYLKDCLSNLERVRVEEEQEKEREERWSHTWQLSVERVKQLYH